MIILKKKFKLLKSNQGVKILEHNAVCKRLLNLTSLNRSDTYWVLPVSIEQLQTSKFYSYGKHRRMIKKKSLTRFRFRCLGYINLFCNGGNDVIVQ